jgi:hypothetical protein
MRRSLFLYGLKLIESSATMSTLSPSVSCLCATDTYEALCCSGSLRSSWSLDHVRSGQTHHGIATLWLQPGDDEAVENLARYIIRASFSHQRMTCVPDESKVTYRSEKEITMGIWGRILTGCCPNSFCDARKAPCLSGSHILCETIRRADNASYQ